MLEFSKITKLELQELYKTHSISGLARLFCVSYYTVHKKLKEFEITLHDRSTSTRSGSQELYGVDNPMLCETVKKTQKRKVFEKYGVECVFSSPTIRAKADKTANEQYGVDCIQNIPGRRKKAMITSKMRFGEGNTNNREQARVTMTERYGVAYPLQNEQLKTKQECTSLERYGVPHNCMTKQCILKGSAHSKINDQFFMLFQEKFNDVEREYALDTFVFDFRINNFVVDINPTITHNSTWTPFSEHEGIPTDYHQRKALAAIHHNFCPIFIYDWDDVDDVIQHMLNSDTSNNSECELYLDKIFSNKQLKLVQSAIITSDIENNIVCDTSNVSLQKVLVVYTAGKIQLL